MKISYVLFLHVIEHMQLQMKPYNTYESKDRQIKAIKPIETVKAFIYLAIFLRLEASEPRKLVMSSVLHIL